MVELNGVRFSSPKEFKDWCDASGIKPEDVLSGKIGDSGGFHSSSYGGSYSYGRKYEESAFKKYAEEAEEYKREIEKLTKEIEEKKAKGEDTSKLEKGLENAKKSFKSIPGVLGKINEDVQNIHKNLSSSYSELKSITEEWGKIDHAASQYTKSLGGTKAAMDKLRDTTLNNVVNGKIGINYDVSTEQLLKMQEDYAKAVGRNIRVDNADQENLAAMHAVMQGGEQELATAFENFGVSLEDVGKHAGTMFSDASKAGISFEKYSKNVSQNIKIAQNYTFKDGLKGLESMAKKATALKLDMQMAASFAEKVNTVEGAIDTSAKLQVLGGPFANFADPIGMLNEGLNDIEGLQDRMAKMIGGLGTFNKETGEVQVSSFNKRRIAEAAQAMGVSQDQLMESVNAQARRKEIGNQIAASKAGSGLSDDMKELIMNSGTFKNGKAGVSINGEFKSIDDLKNGDYEELVKETQSESEDIKDIAKNLRSLVDIQSGAKKQKEDVKAKMTSPIAQLEKKVTTGIANSNVLLGIIAAAEVANSVFNIIGNFKNIGNILATGPFGGLLGKLGGLFSKGLGKLGSLFSKGFGKLGSLFGKGLGKIGGKIGGKVAGKSAAKGVFKYGGDRAVKSGFIKAFGKKGATKLLAGAAKGGGIGIVGAAGNISTDMLVDSGKIKKGGGAHTAMKIGSSALEGAGLGMMIGGPWGAAIGAAIGGTVGAVKAAKAKNEVIVDNQLKALNVERQGNYSRKKLKGIDEALNTGKMSNKLRRKLLKEGDSSIVDAIEAKEKAIQGEKEAKRDKRRENRLKRKEALHREDAEKKVDTAYFKIGVAHFDGGIGKRQTIFKPKPEEGKGEKITPFEKVRRLNNEREGAGAIPTDFNININGSLKLEGSNGQSIDILNIIKKDPQLQREIANLVKQNILEGISQTKTPGKKQDLYQTT